MRKKKKPFRILEERLKYHFIVIELFKRRKGFSFGISTSIGDGGIGRPASKGGTPKVPLDGRYRPAAFIR